VGFSTCVEALVYQPESKCWMWYWSIEYADIEIFAIHMIYKHSL
jgi:hypothetical protein